MRPDLTGLTMVPAVILVLATQSLKASDVHVPLDVRLIILFVVMRLASCNVGLMYSWPS